MPPRSHNSPSSPPSVSVTGNASRRPVPDWAHEIDLCAQGYSLVAGVDEAGRGAWAGPLVAAAVVFPHPQEFMQGRCAPELAEELNRLRDSKMLSPTVREELMGCVRSTALAVGVGIVSAPLLDVIGVGPANRLAMARAVRDLAVRPDCLLIDAFRIPSMPLPQRPVIKGDAKCMSIAAASVVAKVTRDNLMRELEESHPGYGFNHHKGYGTRLHASGLLRHGVTPHHRRSFAPIRALLAGLPYSSASWDGVDADTDAEIETEADMEGEAAYRGVDVGAGEREKAAAR